MELGPWGTRKQDKTAIADCASTVLDEQASGIRRERTIGVCFRGIAPDIQKVGIQVLIHTRLLFVDYFKVQILSIC
jgi:hypothetical protein